EAGQTALAILCPYTVIDGVKTYFKNGVAIHGISNYSSPTIASPAEISDLVHWFDGDDPAVFKADLNCASGATTGSPIGCWINKGSGGNATVAAGDAPIYSETLGAISINALGGLQLTGEMGAVTTPMTVFVVKNQFDDSEAQTL